MQYCGKVVQKLAGREDENHKLCTTLCAPLCLGTRIVQVSFPRFVRSVGVEVRPCAIPSFSHPPEVAGCPCPLVCRLSERSGKESAPLCKYRFLSAFGVWAVRCGGAPFGGFPSRLWWRGAPFRRRGRGGRQAVAGHCARGRPPLPCALPPLRKALRPSTGRGAVVGRLTRGERTGRSGVGLVHSAFAHSDSAHKRAGARA